jgi:hypothetical protein
VTVEGLAGVALLDHGGAGGHRHPPDAAGQVLEARDRQRAQHRHPPQHRDGAVPDTEAPVHRPQRAPGDDRQGRQHHAGEDQRGALVGGCDDYRRDHGAQGDAERDERLEHAEHASEHGVRGHANGQRVEGHVDHRVAQPDEGQHRQRHPVAGRDADDRERQAPEHPAGGAPGSQVPAADEQRDREQPDHSSGADRGPEGGHPGVARAQQLERQHDGQHVERPPHERLGEPEPEDQPEIPVTGRRVQAVDRVAQQPRPADPAPAR